MWGDYDSSGGGGFIQSQGGSASNTTGQSGAKKGSSTSLIPCAISQVLMAAPGGADSAQAGGLVVNDVELNTVSVCGIVRKIEIANTNVTYVVDDFSAPPIEIKQWIDPNEDDVNNLEVGENDYVRVFGSVRSFKGVRNIVSFKIEKLTDMNEMTLHLIEVMHAHLAIQKRHLGGGGGQAGGSFGSSSAGVGSGGGGGYSYTASTTSNFTPMDTGNMSSIHDQGLSGVQKQVYEVITSFKSEMGISSSEIRGILTAVSQNEVKKAIDFLADEGHIYSTIDDDHFKSTSGD